MLDIIPYTLSSALTILFPTFASYKALRTSDPAQLTPWLMYWVVLSLILLVESSIPLIAWFPFYSWIRLLPLTFLLLPGEHQGATYLYQTYIHPFLSTHEADIERLISDTHDKAKKAVFNYIKSAIEFIKVSGLGLQPSRPATPPPKNMSYAQSLLSRFSLPSARQGLAAPAGDFYGLLSAALQQATSSSSRSRDMQAQDLSASGTLVPPGLDTKEERLSYITTQRDRLRVLLQAFDKEADGLGGEDDTGGSSGGMKKSRSEIEFDTITQEDASESVAVGKVSAVQGHWGSWMWGKKESSMTEKPKDE